MADTELEQSELAAALAAALVDDADPFDEDPEAEAAEELPEPEDARAYGIIGHRLQCRQGLGNAYAYDTSSFRPPTTGLMQTRAAFYDSRGVRVFLTGWRGKGSANPYATYSNQWTVRNASIVRSLVIWQMSTGWQWSHWRSCS